MRKLRYSVAMSLDGHIAGPNGEYDWGSGFHGFHRSYFHRFLADSQTATPT